jgi:hypothetical protein
MARYDRIAALSAPDRAEAFNGWSIFRDLEGRERDLELGRRARLRFLALRLVHRMIEQRIEDLSDESFQYQIESVREELGLLPARDPERARIADFLQSLQRGAPIEIAMAALDMGEAAEVEKHEFAADEFYRAALDLANIHQLTPARRIPAKV